MQGCIMATDLGRLHKDLDEMHTLLEENSRESLVANKKPSFQTQQQILECVAHTSDVSFQTRDKKIARKWMDLLFEEFFA